MPWMVCGTFYISYISILFDFAVGKYIYMSVYLRKRYFLSKTKVKYNLECSRISWKDRY